MINKKVVENFLARKLDNHDWLKKLSKRELFIELQEDLKLLPGFDTLWVHQLVCFLLTTTLKRFMLHIDLGGGKALPDDEPVLTPKGWKVMGQLKVGDKVIGANGAPTKILGVFPQGEKQIVTVKFSDGAELRCCLDHLWQVRHPGSKKWKLKTTRELIGDLYYPVWKGNTGIVGGRKWFIPVAAPITFLPQSQPPLDPYLLGVWIGDGTRNSPSITSGDVEIINSIRKVIPTDLKLRISKNSKNSQGYHFVHGKGNAPNWLREKLAALGLLDKYSHGRFIPQIYLTASIEDRLRLLQGLMDTDGYVSKDGKCYFSTSSPQLSKDFTNLVRSLGGTATCNGRRENGHKGHYDTYFVTPPNIVPCTLQRKVNRLVGTRRRKNPPTRGIVSITKDGKQLCTCIKVAAKDGLFIGRDYVVTHNTLITLFSILRRKLLGEKPLAVVFVPYVTAVDTWVQECKKHTPGLKLVPLIGTTIENLRLLEERNGDVFVICYASSVAMLAESPPESTQSRRKKRKWTIDPKRVRKVFAGFDTFVADEIHKCSDIGTLTYRMCRAISSQCSYGIGLSGTPFGKDVEDIWSQFYLIDFGETLGLTKGLFQEAFFIQKQNYFSGFKEYKFDKSKMPVLTKVIKHNSIHYASAEMHDLPPKRYIKVKLPLPTATQQYVSIAAANFIEAMRSKDKNRYRAAEASYLQLRQLASGFMTVDGQNNDKIKVSFDNNPKLDLLEEKLNGIPADSKMVVFHHFVHTNGLISERLCKLRIKHARIWSGQKDVMRELERFRSDPDCRVLVLNDQSGSASLNLQHANYMFFFEQPDSPTTRQQGEGRIYRPGQTKPVHYIDPLMDGTVDERILYANQQGKKLLDELLKGTDL